MILGEPFDPVRDGAVDLDWRAVMVTGENRLLAPVHHEREKELKRIALAALAEPREDPAGEVSPRTSSSVDPFLDMAHKRRYHRWIADGAIVVAPSYGATAPRSSSLRPQWRRRQLGRIGRWHRPG